MVLVNSFQQDFRISWVCTTVNPLLSAPVGPTHLFPVTLEFATLGNSLARWLLRYKAAKKHPKQWGLFSASVRRRKKQKTSVLQKQPARTACLCFCSWTPWSLLMKFQSFLRLHELCSLARSKFGAVTPAIPSFTDLLGLSKCLRHLFLHNHFVA